jgi:hypothetical protein
MDVVDCRHKERLTKEGREARVREWLTERGKDLSRVLDWCRIIPLDRWVWCRKKSSFRYHTCDRQGAHCREEAGKGG